MVTIRESEDDETDHEETEGKPATETIDKVIKKFFADMPPPQEFDHKGPTGPMTQGA